MNTPIVAPEVPTTRILDLAGKAAVITGGSKDIGAATVGRFVKGEER